MPSLTKIAADWTAFKGGPGVTNFYYQSATFTSLSISEADVAGGDIRTFFAAVAAYLPVTVEIQVRALFQDLDEASGDLLAERTLSAVPGKVFGTGAGAYSAVSGASVGWRTATAVEGRLVRGRTFLVPMVQTAYELDGTLSPACITAVQGAANAMFAGASNLAVYHRPRPATVARPVASFGKAAQVTAARVADKAAVLRSRRD